MLKLSGTPEEITKQINKIIYDYGNITLEEYLNNRKQENDKT